MVNGWRTGPEGIDAFLTRAGFGDALTTDASQSDVASADGIRDLLNQGRAATDGDDLITGISLAIQAAHLAARHDLPQPAADAVLLLARILVGTGNTEAAGDALAFAARLTTVLMADGQAADVPLVIAQLALVAIYFPLSGQPGQQIQAELTPICETFQREGNTPAMAWTALVLAQAATEGGDVATGEQYLRLTLECMAGRLPVPDPPAIRFPAPEDGVLLTVMLVVAGGFLRAKELVKAKAWAAVSTEADPESWRTWRLLSEVQRQAAQYEPALASLDRAVALRPDMLVFKLEAASLLASLGRFGDAAEQATEVIKIAPGYADAWMARIETLITAAPDDPVLLGLRGYALAQAGHRDRAMADLDRALMLASDDAEIRMRRGQVRLRLNGDLADPKTEPLDSQTVMDSLEDLAVSARVLSEKASAAYIWLADRVTADDWFRAQLVRVGGPASIPAVVPAAREPLQAWLTGQALADRRQWKQSIEGFTAARQGLAALGFACFASRVDLEIADCHIRLGQLQQARLLLDHWNDTSIALHFSPWSAQLNADRDEVHRAVIGTMGIRPATPELEYARVYSIGFSGTLRHAAILDALLAGRIGDSGAALSMLGHLESRGDRADIESGAWFDVATILRDAGETERALAMADRALADPAFLAGDRSRAENLRGTLLLLLRRPREAEQAFRRSRRAARGLGDTYGAVVSEANLAMAMIRRGRPRRALAVLDRIQEEARLGPGQIHQKWHSVRAIALAEQNRLGEAEADAAEAVRLSEEILASLRTADLQTTWQGSSRDLYNLAVGISMRAGHISKALDLVEMARSRAFFFQLATRMPEVVASAPGRPEPSDTERAATALDQRRRVLARLLPAARHHGPAGPDIRTELQRVGVKIEDVTDPAGSDDQTVPRLSADKLLALLQDTATRLDQARRLQAGVATTAAGAPAAPVPLTVEGLQALAADEPGGWQPFTLAELFATDDAIYLFMVVPGSPAPRGIPLDTDSEAATLASLTTRIGAWVPSGTRLGLVAHGRLSAFPFHVLDVDGVPMGLRNPVFYAPSASILEICRSRSRPRRQSGVVLADSGLGAPAPILRGQAVALAAKLDEHRVLLGPDASRASLLAALGDLDAGLVHLAIHGRFEAKDPTLSAIALADGWLTAEELAGLDLHADLVTLAACHSGVTGLIGDDEILGLTRAMLHAGVASVLVADQAVEEVPTALLLEYFYDELLTGGRPKADALRSAQARLRATTVSQVLAYLAANEAMIAGDLPGQAHLLLTEAELHAEAWSFERADQQFSRLQELLASGSPASPAGLAERAEAGRARVQLMARTGRTADYERTPFTDPAYWGPFVLVGDWH